MKKVVGLVGVVAAAVFLFFWFNQERTVEETATTDFSQTEQVTSSTDFFTKWDLNELEAVVYSKHQKLLDDLTGEELLVRRTTQKEFIGAKRNEDGLSWTGYFEK